MLFIAVPTKPYRGKNFKGLNHCTTNYSVYLFKCIRILTVQVSATENCLTNASILSQGYSFETSLSFCFVMLCSGKGGWGGNTRDKPRTKVSQAQNSFLAEALISLLPGARLGNSTGPLAMNLCHYLKSRFHHAGQPVWDALARRLQKRSENKEHSVDVCICEQTGLSCLHLRPIYCGLSSY